MSDIIERIDQFSATDFQKLVWKELINIPKGKTISYSELASKIGNPKAVRAVANAVGKNPFAPVVPCHRVVRKNGEIGGYSGVGGVATKKRLLLGENGQE
jgi:methylated-DNA-[protein]-cysteine S-methyltransferase